MREFLSWLDADVGFIAHGHDLGAAFGIDAAQTLITAGILKAVERPKSFCCKFGPRACERLVVGLGTPNVMAKCFEDLSNCGETPLTTPVKGYGMNLPAWIGTLQRLLRTDEPFTEVDLFPKSWWLGTTTWSGVQRRVMYTLATREVGFTSLFRSSGEKRLVLVNSRQSVGGRDNDHDIGADNVVQLAFLDDYLDMQADQIVLRSPGDVEVPESESSEPRCIRMIERARSTDITIDQARALRATAQNFDLFLDLTSSVGAGFEATVRDEEGHSKQVQLTKGEAFAVATIVSEKRPWSLGEIDLGDHVNHVDKIVEAARRKVDRPVSRYGWHIFKTLRGKTPKAKKYLFDPPEAYRYLVLRPALR